MRLHRRNRIGRYRAGAKRKPKKKTVMRVLFVILCAAVLTGLSVLLGTHLKERAMYAETMSADTTDAATETEQPTELFGDGIVSTSDASSLKLFAADIDVTKGNPESIKALIDGMSDDYNAISIRITSDSGELIYTSEALLRLVGVDAGGAVQNTAETSDPAEPEATDKDDGGDESSDAPESKVAEASTVLDNLKSAIAAASERSLRCSAIYGIRADIFSDGVDAATASVIDRTVIEELDALGFDEVIIDGVVEDDDLLSYEKTGRIISYLALLRAGEGDIDIGLTLPSSVYLISQNASRIKTLSSYADFLAIGISAGDMSPDEAYSFVYDSCYSLKGNFSAYNIRGIIEDTDGEVADAVCASLRALSVENIQFSVYVKSPGFVPDRGDKSTTASMDGAVNDNALRRDDYESSETSEDE